MRPFDELVAALGEALLATSGGPAAGARVEVTAVDLSLPLEARLVAGGELRASLPRGIMATGFEAPLGRIVARFRASAKERA